MNQNYGIRLQWLALFILLIPALAASIVAMSRDIEPTPTLVSVSSTSTTFPTVTATFVATSSPTVVPPSASAAFIFTPIPTVPSQTPSPTTTPFPTNTPIPTPLGSIGLTYPPEKERFSNGCRNLTFQWTYTFQQSVTFAIAIYHKTGQKYEFVKEVGGTTTDYKWEMFSSLNDGDYKWRVDLMDQNRKAILSSEEKTFSCYSVDK